MRLELKVFDLKLVNPWTIATTLSQGGGSGVDSSVTRVIVVRIQTKDGFTGYGESSPPRRYGESLETVSAFLKAVDSSRLDSKDIPGSMRYLETLGPGNASAKSAINQALWDLSGKRLGMSVWQGLGLHFEEGRHLTSFSIGIDSPESIYRKVLEAAPYPILKLKLGSPEDAENLRALRSAAPGKTVRVDANEAWKTKEEALERLEWLAEDPGIELVEQPMPASVPVEDWEWLRDRSPLILMADESCHTSGDVERCARMVHAVNVKLIKTGGISEAYNTLQTARAKGLKTMLGCMIESSVAISAAAQLAGLTDYLDLDGHLLISNDPFEGVTCQEGKVSFAGATEKCGLGVRMREGLQWP